MPYLVSPAEYGWYKMGWKAVAFSSLILECFGSSKDVGQFGEQTIGDALKVAGFAEDAVAGAFVSMGGEFAKAGGAIGGAFEDVGEKIIDKDTWNPSKW